jgi:arsenate reductase
MAKIIVYQKPTCTTSRKAIKYLNEKGIEFEKVNYYEKRFTKNKLKTLLKKMGLKAEDILRKRDKAYKELDLKNKKYSQAELIALMAENPDLIERPIVEKGEKAVLARPVEKIDELLK